MGTRGVVAGLLLVVLAGVRTSSQTQSQSARSEPGSEACSGCHAEIYKSYSKTEMANSSGLAIDGVTPGEFSHKTSEVRYRVYKQDEQGRPSLGPSGSETRTHTVWMSYERASEKFRGQRELLYFVGSGKKARSHLFSVQGYQFQSPIDWYAQDSRWGMAPGYAEARETPLNLPAFTECVNCHASGVQPPLPGTDNKFSGAPFLHGGIACQRCHGAGEGHGQSSATSSIVSLPSASSPTASSPSGNPAIVNPAKLPPDRRDAICMECHFQGTVGVEQPGKHLYQFQAGERISDYVHYFLLSGNQPETAQALSQFEALSLSECKRRSGDKMWCGSCHDPHAEPAAEEKAAYYRSKCLNCHGEAFAAKHHPEKPDCTKCHMPASPGKDVLHLEATDHRILRYPNTRPLPRLQVRGTMGAPLVAFPESDAPLATTRDFALAWESLAQHNVEGASQRAEEFLRKAVQERPEDPVLLTAFGWVEQKHEHEKEAREFFERAWKLDPLANDAAVDLGVLEARAGNLRRAVELWQVVFNREPYRSAIGLNLAMAFCVADKKDVAREFLQRALEFNPDYLKGKQLLAHLGEEQGQCRP